MEIKLLEWISDIMKETSRIHSSIIFINRDVRDVRLKK